MRKSRTLINPRDLTRCPVLLLLRIVMASLAGSVDIKSLIVDAYGNLLDTLSTFSHFLWLNFLEIAVLQQLAHILGMDSGLPFFVFSTTKVLQMFVKILKKLVPETFGFSFVKFSHSQLFPLPTLPTSNSSHFLLFPSILIFILTLILVFIIWTFIFIILAFFLVFLFYPFSLIVEILFFNASPFK